MDLSCQISEAHITNSLCSFATASLSLGFSMLRCSHTKVIVVERDLQSFHPDLHCASVVGADLSNEGLSSCKALPGLHAHKRGVAALMGGQA